MVRRWKSLLWGWAGIELIFCGDGYRHWIGMGGMETKSVGWVGMEWKLDGDGNEI